MTLLLIFPVIALLCAPAYWMVLGRRNHPLPTAPPASPSPRTLSIIIPARNEAHNIGNLLQSINKQPHPPHEIIVINDHSTDNTAEIAQEHNATVINAQALPDGWKGKPWACQQGAEAATGDWLLFLDADTLLENNSLPALVALTNDPGQVYSLCPYHRIQQAYEQLSAFFNVLMLAGSNALSLAKNQPHTLFGQCLLISRNHYKQVGGHATVKHHILENFHLTSHLQELDIACQSRPGKGIISMRMHPQGMGELWSSWQKGFSSGAANTPPRALLFSSIWISGLMFILVSLVLLVTPYATPVYGGLTAAIYLLFAVQCLQAFRIAGNFSPINALLFPVSLLFYQTLFFSSIIQKKRGKTTTWKQRQVD